MSQEIKQIYGRVCTPIETDWNGVTLLDGERVLLSNDTKNQIIGEVIKYNKENQTYYFPKAGDGLKTDEYNKFSIKLSKDSPCLRFSLEDQSLKLDYNTDHFKIVDNQLTLKNPTSGGGGGSDISTLSDDQIYLSEPYTFTKDFGYYTLKSDESFIKVGEKEDGNMMTLKEFLSGAFSQVDNDVLAVSPSFTITISNISESAEIGTTVIPTAEVSTDVGSYKYGTEEQKTTGVTFTEIKINNESGDTLDLDSITYTNDINICEATATATRKGATNKPINNLGEELDIPTSIKFDEEISDTTSKTFIGYREGCFWGSVPNISSSNDINGYLIRKLKNKLQTNYKSKELTHTVAIGDTAIIIACPKNESITGPTSILNTTVNAEMIASFSQTEVEVGGADATEENKGNYATYYNVWYYIPASGAYTQSANLKITLG